MSTSSHPMFGAVREYTVSISPPSKLGSGSKESRPSFLFSGEDYPAISQKTALARKHCAWAYSAGNTPQDVLEGLRRPSHPLSTWEDACRAVEASMYAMDHKAVRDAYQEHLKCL